MARGTRALILTADDFEDLEVMVPKIRLEEEGWTVSVAAPDSGRVVGEHGYDVDAESALDDVDASEYDLLVLPGGPPSGGAGTVRRYRSARRIVQHFMEEGKPVGAICHGPYTLISADVLDGRRLTSVTTDGVPDEIEEAGAEWVDEEVVVDGNLVTSRTPEDLPAFLRELVSLARKGASRPAHARKTSRKASKAPARASRPGKPGKGPSAGERGSRAHESAPEMGSAE